MKADRAKLLESSITIKFNLERRAQELQFQLDAEKKRVEEVWEELEDSEKACENLRRELVDREKELATALAEVLDLKQKSAAASKDLPEAADLLNQLKKAKGKKSSASLADVEAILEILEESCDDTSQRHQESSPL